MKRREFQFTVGAAVFTLASVGMLAATLFHHSPPVPPPLEVGPRRPRVPLLGVMWPGTISVYENAFWQALRDEGFIDGETLLVEYRETEDNAERLPEIAAELVSTGVELVFAATAAEAQAVRVAIQDAGLAIPIVTGLAREDPEFEGKRLEILKEAFPRLSRVAYLASRTDPGATETSRPATERAARAIGVRLDVTEVDSPEDLEPAFSRIARQRSEAVMVPPTPLFLAQRDRILSLAMDRRLPAMYGDALFVEEGGLFFYGTPLVDQFRLSAVLVAKALRGANPADFPVEQPRSFKLIINLRTARAVGFAVPPALLLRADRVIE